MDKNNILAGVTYASSGKMLDVEKQSKKLRQNIFVFWHEMSHFITAMGRGQLWWAHGQLDSLRSICVNLARLQHDFSDPEVGEEPYFKIENWMPVESLAPLKVTFCPLEWNAMLQSVRVILSFYAEVARSLAGAHNISYPERLENVMRTRLLHLQDGPVSSGSE